MDFQTLKEKNIDRNEEQFSAIVNWPLVFWACAVTGEAGEMANLVKKQFRGDDIDPTEIGKEIADIVIYCDLMATRMGFDLGDLVASKFNEKSREWGSEVFIEAHQL